MKKSIYMLLAVALMGGPAMTLQSCSDDDETTLTRLFRPILDDPEVGLDANNQPFIALKWDNYSSANGYHLTVEATDGTGHQEADTDGTEHTFSGLQYDKEYNITIRALNSETGAESKDYQTSVTTLDFPTQLRAVTSVNIIDTQARILWNTTDGSDNPVDYTALRVYKQSNDSLVADHEVIDTETAAGETIIKNLAAGTEYRVEAWSGDTYLGKRLFRTAQAQEFEGAVVDLRGLDDDDAFKAVSTAMIDSVVGVYPDQDVNIVLEGGQTYRLAGTNLPNTTGTIRFITGQSLGGYAKFAVTGNFGVNADTQVGGVSFTNIEFTDHESKPRTSGNYGGTYIFNINKAGATIGSVSFEGCSIKYKRGVFRIQAASVVENLSINNCVIDSIGGYGITNADNAGAEIRNIRLTNSTVSNAALTFVATKGPAPQSITVDHCTFCYSVASGRFLFNVNKAVAGGITLSNTIIGHPGETTAKLSTGFRGWANADAVPTCSGVYLTSDLVYDPKSADDPSPRAELAADYLSTITAETFRDPEHGDFTLISSDAAKTGAGDPRWNP